MTGETTKVSESRPSDLIRPASAKGKPMSMVAFGATRGAVDISFPGATMAMIGWPHSKTGLRFRSNVNDVAIHLPVNDVLILIN